MSQTRGCCCRRPPQPETRLPLHGGAPNDGAEVLWLAEHRGGQGRLDVPKWEEEMAETPSALPPTAGGAASRPGGEQTRARRS